MKPEPAISETPVVNPDAPTASGATQTDAAILSGAASSNDTSADAPGLAALTLADDHADAAPDSPLTSRVQTSVGWTAASTLSAQFMSLVRSMALARLLSLADLGLYGMAHSVTEALSVLTNAGMDQAAIVQEVEDEAALSRSLATIWWAELGRRVVFTFLVLLCVVPTSRFYHEPRLLWILPILSLKWLVEGFQNIGLILLRRQVRFARVFWFEQTSLFLFTLLSLGLAWRLRSVWALVLAQVLHSLAWVALSYRFHPFRPRLNFDRAVFRKAFHFGKYVFVIGVATYVLTTADNIVVARQLGASVFGAYFYAYAIANMCLVAVRDIISRVMFPAYAELARRGGAQVRGALTRVFRVGAGLLALMAAPMALLAPELTRLLYGPKWTATGPMLRALTWVGLFHGLTQMMASLLIGLSRPELDARPKVAEAVLFVVLLTPLTARYGVTGAALAGALVYGWAFLVRLWLVNRLVPGVMPGLLGTLGLALTACAAGIGCGALAIHALDSPIARLVIGGAASTLTVVVCLLAFLPALRKEAASAGRIVTRRRERQAQELPK